MPESAIEARRAKYLAEREALTRKQNEADKMREKTKPYSDSPRDVGKSILKGPSNSPLPLHSTKVEYNKFILRSREPNVNFTGRTFDPTPTNRLKFGNGPIKEWDEAKEALANLLKRETGSLAAIELLVLLHRNIPHEHLYPELTLRRTRVELKRRGLLAKRTGRTLTPRGRLVALAIDSFAKEKLTDKEPMLPFLLQAGLATRKNEEIKPTNGGELLKIILKARYLDYNSSKASSPGMFHPKTDIPLHNAREIAEHPTMFGKAIGISREDALAYAASVFVAKGKTIPPKLAGLPPRPVREKQVVENRSPRRTQPESVVARPRNTIPYGSPVNRPAHTTDKVKAVGESRAAKGSESKRPSLGMRLLNGLRKLNPLKRNV